MSVFNSKHNSSCYQYEQNQGVYETKQSSSHIQIPSCENLEHSWYGNEPKNLPELEFIFPNHFNISYDIKSDKSSWYQRDIWDETLVAEDVQDSVVR